MISVILQGFVILLFVFLIGLPVGDLLAHQIQRWLRRRRPETERLSAMIAGAAPAAIAQPPLGTVTYPTSVLGHRSLSVRKDQETPLPTPPADPAISRSLQPPVQ